MIELLILYLCIGITITSFAAFVAADTAIEKRDEPTIRGMIFLCFGWPIVAIGFAISLVRGGKNDRH